MYRLILPFFLMCMAGAIGLFIVSPQYEEVRQLKIEEEALLSDLEDVKTINAKVEALRAQHAKFPPGSETKLNILLPGHVDSVRLIVDVNALVEKHGLIMRNPFVTTPGTSPKQPGKAQTSKSLIKFEIVATYDEFRAFLADVDRSLALRDISTVEFSATDASGGVKYFNKKGELIRTYFVELGTYSFN